jgi:hypothetical protein
MEEIKEIIDKAHENGLMSLTSYNSTKNTGANWIIIKEAQDTLSKIRKIVKEETDKRSS